MGALVCSGESAKPSTMRVVRWLTNAGGPPLSSGYSLPCKAPIPSTAAIRCAVVRFYWFYLRMHGALCKRL
jgi:hypothetical protein